MRFLNAWANIATENSILKLCLLTSSLLGIFFAGSAAILSFRAPLVVDRSCYSSPAKLTSPQHTKEEVESFLRVALTKRFDTADSTRTTWFSYEEDARKESERKELASKKIKQMAIVGDVDIAEAMATVQVDRILAVDKFKSVVPAVVEVSFATTPRSEANAYGLVIEKVSLKKEAQNAK